MIQMQQWMEVVNYRITEGSTYDWQCYGPDAYRLDSWNGEHNGHSLSIVFDTKTQVVYEVDMCDYKNNRAYRMINPCVADKYKEETVTREMADQESEAWDGVNYITLDVVDDFLEKAKAVIAGEEYDSRVEIELTLEDAALHELMVMAHEKDITLNAMVEQILRSEIVRIESDKSRNNG